MSHENDNGGEDRRTGPVRPHPVQLYMKPGCHLCEQAEADLERLRHRYPHQLQLVDISGDPELLGRYGESIPVLVIGDRAYAAPLSRATLELALQEGAGAHAG